MRDNGQQGGMSARAKRIKMKTTRMRRTRMRTRGEDDKVDEDQGQQGGRGTATRTQDKDVDNEGQRDEYKDCKLYCKISWFYVLSIVLLFGLQRIYFFS